MVAILAAILLSGMPALALTPRVAICGRVTSFADATPPADRIVKLGTQEPRRLSLGSGGLQVGQEVCIWGYDVENMNPPVPDPAPKGIVGCSIAPVASIGCADAVTATTVSFIMPRESGLPDALPSAATLTLPLGTPAAAGCVRVAVDGQGNPIAVLVLKETSPSPAVSPPTPRPSVASLPSANPSEERGLLALAFVAVGALVAAAGLLARRRTRRAIPS